MNWGMISYEIPLSVYPDTYNGKPLMYCALAAQKRHNAVYLMNIYADSELERKTGGAGMRRAGLKLDRGKCMRAFQKAVRRGPGDHRRHRRRDQHGTLHRALCCDPRKEMSRAPGGY